MLIVLTAINVCNAMDRTLISVLLPNIKNELHISDSQIGFLTGAAFALFYASLGLPLGWLAERVNRTRLISVALVTWSAMTAASGFATSFLALMALRVGVAVGEAGGSPPSYGMIADSFARTNRTFAMAVFTSAGAIGGFLALFVGGWIDQFWGWRVAFFAAGAFGLALLPFILLTVRDPQRGHSDGNTGVQVQVTVRNAAARLSSSRAFKHLVIGGTLSAFVVYSLAIWLPSFLSRSFALKSGEIGTWLGLITLFTGLMGTFSGGELARRMGARNLAWWGWTPVIGFSIAGPATVLAIMSYDLYVCLAALALSHFGVCFYMGPLFASVGTIVPPGMRSIASSALLFVQMILGLGLGPLLTGMVSDAATKSFGVEALRYALLLPTAAMVWAAFHYWMAARTIGEESASAIGDAPYAPNVIQKEQPA
ncbi:Sialic acid transporter NanT [Alphaproteobacteria bacterium SO-S41]|nr:Sialic acid transporter NanT [Alphaproteobacteria bacterium SO-S41]